MNLEINSKYYSEANDKTNVVVVCTNPFLSFTAVLEGNQINLDNNTLIEKATDWLFKLLFVDKAMPETIIKVEELEKQIEDAKTNLSNINYKIYDLENEQKIIAEYAQKAMTPEQIQEYAVDWVSDAEYPRFSYVLFEGETYKLNHPKQAHNTATPIEAPEIYVKTGSTDQTTGLPELTPSSENIYKSGTIGIYEGRVYKSNYDNNGTLPGTPAGQGWWTDLGSIEEYRG